MTDQIISEKDNLSLISCKIQPSASKTAFVGIYDNAMKFSIASPPTDGKANKALCTFIAKQLKLPKSFVKIANGAKSKNKIISCQNCTKKQIMEIFNILG